MNVGLYLILGHCLSLMRAYWCFERVLDVYGIEADITTLALASIVLASSFVPPYDFLHQQIGCIRDICEKYVFLVM